MPTLSDLEVEWVSLVDKAAVRNPSNPSEPQRFLLWKRESGQPTEKGDPVSQDMDALSAALQKAEAERDSLSEQLKATKSELEALKKEEHTAAEQIDKSELPEPVRAALEKAEREAEATRKRAEEAEKVAKAERDARITREFIAKAEGFRALPISADELGMVLKSASEQLPAESFGRLEQLLAATNEQLTQSELIKEQGRSGEPTPGVDEIDSLRKRAEEIRKADPSLSEFDAMRQAMDRQAQLAYLNAAR